MSELDALVVGGGISGLAVAHCLARSGLEVEVWESEQRAGGKIRTTALDGYRLESAASMAVEFGGELGPFLRSAGLAASRRACAQGGARFVLHGGRLLEAPAGLGGLLRTPLLGARGKLRMLAEPLVPRGRDARESVAAFVTRRLGREFLEKLFEPYVAGPLASDAALAEARAVVPKLKALEQRWGSLALGALLKRASHSGRPVRPEAFSFAGGMATLPERLAAAGGFRVRTGQRAGEVWPVAGGWMARGVRGDQARAIFCRQLVLSVPPDAAASLLQSVDAGLARLLCAVRFAPISVVHTGFARARVGHALNGSGFLTARGSDFAVNGCQWISQIFPGRAPEGRVLLASYLGAARNPDAAHWSTARSVAEVMRMLRPVLGVRGEPELLHVERHARGLPLYHGAYSELLAAMDRRLAKLPGLHLEANYRGGVSVRDRVACAERAAMRILRQREAARRSSTPSISPAAGIPELARAAPGLP